MDRLSFLGLTVRIGDHAEVIFGNRNYYLACGQELIPTTIVSAVVVGLAIAIGHYFRGRQEKPPSQSSRRLVHLPERTDLMTAGILEAVQSLTLLPDHAYCRFESLTGVPVGVHADYDIENTTYNGCGSDDTVRSAPSIPGHGDAADDIRHSLPRRSQSTTALRRPPRLKKTGSRIPLPSRPSAFGHRPRIDHIPSCPSAKQPHKMQCGLQKDNA